MCRNFFASESSWSEQRRDWMISTIHFDLVRSIFRALR
jgi:hypothetical protein